MPIGYAHILYLYTILTRNSPAISLSLDESTAIANHVEDIFSTMKTNENGESSEKKKTDDSEGMKEKGKKITPTFLMAKFDFDAEDAQEVRLIGP